MNWREDTEAAELPDMGVVVNGTVGLRDSKFYRWDVSDRRDGCGDSWPRWAAEKSYLEMGTPELSSDGWGELVDEVGWGCDFMQRERWVW